MPTIIQKLEHAISEARASDKSLPATLSFQVLLPATAFAKAQKEIREYMRSSGVSYFGGFSIGNELPHLGVSSLILDGISCHLIEAQVVQTIIFLGEPVAQLQDPHNAALAETDETRIG